MTLLLLSSDRTDNIAEIAHLIIQIVHKFGAVLIVAVLLMSSVMLSL